MNRCIGPVLMLLLCISPTVRAQESAHGDSIANGSRDVTITLIERNVTDKVLQLRYQIRNGSDRDIWICTAVEDRGRWGVRAHAGQESGTLVVERRLESIRDGWQTMPEGRYVRLRGGETRNEVMSLSLPTYVGTAYFDETTSRPPKRAARLLLRIGYCEGDLPARLSGTSSKGTRVWDEEIVVPWQDRVLKEEKVLWMMVEDVAIPYHEQYRKPSPIHLSPCKRIEVHFRQSPLEFFFPYTQQQLLLSPKEQQYLQSLKDFVLEDRWDLMGIAYDASEAVDDAFFTERRAVDLTCHRRDGSVVSLTVHDRGCIETAEGQVFRCLDGLTRLRMLTPRIQALDQRVQCAANLKELWYDFRRYHARLVPPADEWCDALGMREHACPSAGKGKCHYAMNPHCKRDSPADMVLLFETRAGWNQHGGPELFTFKNHKPQGGCVLLNDGTVKFVRTKQELKQSRWQ